MMCDCDTLLATDDIECWQGICSIVNPLQLSVSHLATESLMLILMYDGYQEGYLGRARIGVVFSLP
jgi:hypothetical protein